MPNAPLRPCSYAGCKALVVAGACDQHRTNARANARAYDATVRQDTPALALAAQIRGSAQWQQLRAAHRNLEPFCRDPFRVHGSFPPPARASHHIEPLATRPDLAFEIANLAGVCVPCHARTEALERAGRPTAHLFAGGPRPLGKICRTPTPVEKSGEKAIPPRGLHDAHFRKNGENGQPAPIGRQKNQQTEAANSK